MKEFDRHMDTIKACRFCPMCRNTCTVGEAEHRETVTPKGKALTIFTCMNGIQPFNGDVAEVMYHCNLCQLCNATCEGSWDITGIVMEARRKSAAMGLEPKRVQEMKDHIVSHGNPYGADRVKGIDSLNLPKIEKKAFVLYFSGCNTAYEHPEIIKSVVKILESAGESFVMLNEEGCCGAYLDVMGYRDDARNLAKKNVKQFVDSGCSILLTSCPHCYYTIKEMYGQWGEKLPNGMHIVHTSSYIRKMLFQNRISLRSLRAKATYHDPCRLGRYCGIYEEPREIIKAFDGVEFIEMKWNRDKARCCGYGSGMAITNPDVAKEAAKQRMYDLRKTGAELVITSCPSCKGAFTKNLLSDDQQRILDLTELVAENMS